MVSLWFALAGCFRRYHTPRLCRTFHVTSGVFAAVWWTKENIPWMSCLIALHMNPTQKGGKVSIQYVRLGPRATQHQITCTLRKAMSWAGNSSEETSTLLFPPNMKSRWGPKLQNRWSRVFTSRELKYSDSRRSTTLTIPAPMSPASCVNSSIISVSINPQISFIRLKKGACLWPVVSGIIEANMQLLPKLLGLDTLKKGQVGIQ